MKTIYIIFLLILPVIFYFSIKSNRSPEKVISTENLKQKIEWQEYRDEFDFSFKYPPEFSDIKKEGVFTYFIRSKQNGGGSFYVRTKYEAINPNRFSGLEGIITDPDKFSIGDRIGYSWVEKDGNCMERALMAEVYGKRTLVMGFRACDNDEPIYKNIDLINSILKTFDFSKTNREI